MQFLQGDLPKYDAPESSLDGLTHINIYSKGKTEVGRMLSNFYMCDIDTPWGEFKSIEAYWFWLLIKPDCKERKYLKVSSGFKAKEFGSSLAKNNFNTGIDENKFKDLIKNAIHDKYERNPRIKIALRESDLPFYHYYVYGGKSSWAGYVWLCDIWEKIRKENND